MDLYELDADGNLVLICSGTEREVLLQVMEQAQQCVIWNLDSPILP